MKEHVPVSISRRVEFKIADGDVKGAVKILSSTDTLAPHSEFTLNQLKSKHPPPSQEINLPEPPDENSQPLVVSEREVYKMIQNFPNGSAAGIDGILPQHLKDLTAPLTGEAGLKLLKTLTCLSNFMLAAKMPSRLCSIMYGASLCALNKLDGGIRPIAVGNTFRRLVAKLACASVRPEMAAKFAPKQVGFGTPGGCEAAAHATRTFIKKNASRRAVLLKIDFRNAFNELHRDAFLNEVKVNNPSIYPFLWQCYSTSSYLFYGEDIILSQNGAQQGDPCGPLVFCSAIHSVVTALVSEFVVFYLDDGTIASTHEEVLQDFKKIINECSRIGLHINPTKCELFFCADVDQEIVNQFDEVSPGILVVNELTLLGAPISENSFATVFNKKLRQLKLLFDRLEELDNYHISYYILKNCCSIPKLVFLLRTTPIGQCNDIVDEMDKCIRSTMETLTNSKLNEIQWILSSLPINNGGLGVRRIRDIALPAFLSSVNGLLPLVSFMLQQPSLNIVDIGDYNDNLNAWDSLNPNTNHPTTPSRQKEWNVINVVRLISEIHFETDSDKARFLAIQKSESSAWLHALPSRSIGTLLNNNYFRIAIGLRLGTDLCEPHKCRCGVTVDKKGHHGLKCSKSAGRYSRHTELNLIIKRALASADVPSVLEPVGLVREDGKRVDGMTLITWSRGQTLIWDSTCTDTFAPSNIRLSVSEAGRAANDKARRKTRKYESLINQNFHFVPFAVETMGTWGTEAMKFFNILGKMMSQTSNEPRCKSFLKQRLSMAIQRGNAAVMGTFSENDKMEEIFYL